MAGYIPGMPRTRTTLLTTLALAGTAAALPAAAQAQNPYTGKGICGPAYELSREVPLRSNNGAVQMGRMQVLYGFGVENKTCVVLLKDRQVGRATFTSLRAAGFVKNPLKTQWREDAKEYSYYAGPLYFKDVPNCVRIGGYMNVPEGREGILVEGGYRSVRCRPVR